MCMTNEYVTPKFFFVKRAAADQVSFRTNQTFNGYSIKTSLAVRGKHDLLQCQMSKFKKCLMEEFCVLNFFTQ